MLKNINEDSKSDGMLTLSAGEIYESLPGAILWCTTEEVPRIIFCNEKAAAYMESEKRILEEGASLLPFIYPDDREALQHKICNYCKTKEAEEPLELRLTSVSGNKRWMSVSLSLFRMSGEPVLQLYFTDITEVKLYQDIVNDTADGIYVINTESFELLYANETADLFPREKKVILGEKCYKALQGKSVPCDFCTLSREPEDGRPMEMFVPHTGRTYATKIKDTEWNGVPAVVQYVTDITESKKHQREKEQLEAYYQALIKHLPGGIAVTTIYRDGTLDPEFFSEGFAAMMGMTVEQASDFYKMGIEARIHLEERDEALNALFTHLDAKSDSWESVYRLQRGDGTYLWVRNISSLILETNGTVKIYAIYIDVSRDMKNQQELRQKYDNMVLNHYKGTSTNEIVSGHCNVTKNIIIDIADTTGNQLLDTFGYQRDDFFSGISSLIVDEKERQEFLDRFLTQPMIQAYERKETKHEMECFVKLPNEKHGRYVHIIVILVSSPETGDIMGFLSLLDVTEMKISGELFLRLAKESYDFIADVDLLEDRYNLISVNQNSVSVPREKGSFAHEAMEQLCAEVVPKDRQTCRAMLNHEYIKEQLKQKNSYYFHYSIVDEEGDIRTKNMLVFSIDKRLERICLACVDVTESVREQQGLLNMLAYTFELAGFLDVDTDSFVMYTRESVLRNLAPYQSNDFFMLVEDVVDRYCVEEDQEDLRFQLSKETMLQRLEKSAEGYDLTFRLDYGGKIRHKQYNILWSDESHKTICLVRADVTDVLNRERQSKEELKNALAIAQEANRAKSDFLSSMSHDIRTPMNAIIGMTDLAIADRRNEKQIDESLSVIKSSSEHLLRLINDILDMSRIESGRMVLAKEPFNQKEEMDKLADRCRALAEKNQLHFEYRLDIRHYDCIGDLLRTTKVLENLLGNAIKFTPQGGTVSLEITELQEKGGKSIGWYRYVVSDNGVGIEEENLPHIFEPFYRTESSMISRTEGSGLGLSIVKNIVDYKGGTIDVRSQQGKGTSFYVELPIHFADEPIEVQSADPQREDVAADLRDIRILLVEDNELNQLIAIKILENSGAKVTVASNGEEGAAAFEGSEPGDFDIIMMDIQMPVMNGYDATRVIRTSTHPQAQTIPVIAMTANVFASDVKKCLDAGMDAHIAKPIDLKKLYAVVNEYWEKRKRK